jgi:hypothetical protein
MRKRIRLGAGLVSVLMMCLLLATAAFAAVPELVTKCGDSVQKWVCAPAQPASKPAGWYTPSSAIPAGKSIYSNCSMQCSFGYNPVTGACMGYTSDWVPRANHANDIVLPSGARRAWCGTEASHVSALYTFP